MTYHPGLVTQLDDGCACPAKDCAACSLSMLAKRVSVGRWDLSPCRIRSKASISCSDGTGGIPYGPGAEAVRLLTGGEVDLRVYTGRTRTQVRDALQAGSGVVLSIKYGVLLGTQYACSTSFTGGHAVYENSYKVIADKPDTMYHGDPLADGRYIPYGGGRRFPDGYMNARASLLFRAAEARNGGSIGSASITIVKGRDTEGTDRKARLAAAVHTDPQPGAKVTGHLKLGGTYTVRSTTNGGPWERDTDGGTSKGWHRLDAGGYVKGEALV